jgi:predicted CXXCH cytochrome family protein
MATPPFSVWVPPGAQEGWAEGAVGCEMCHGPGRAHVETVRRMGDAGYRAHLAAGGEPTIYDPGKDTLENRMKQCDACHNFMSESTVTWVPTPRGYDHEMLSEPMRPRAGAERDLSFYPDGTDMSPCTVGRVFRHSKMGRTGRIECRTCHDSHGNDHWAELLVEGNRLCTGCHLGNHRELADPKALEAHTRHPADGPGSSCLECHMRRDKRFTNGVEVMSDLLPSHDFGTPTGEEPENGPGPSCLVCHTDRDRAWTRETLRRWR